MSGKSLEQKVRDIRDIINRRYGRYMAPESGRRVIKTALHSTAKAWSSARKSYLGRTLDHYIKDVRESDPGTYSKWRQAAGGSSKSLRGIARGSRVRGGVLSPDTGGLYDKYNNRIEVQSDDVDLIAHELLHAYSHQRDKRGPFCNFCEFVDHKTMESVTEALAQEVYKEYIRTKLGPREFVPTSQSAYSLDPAKNFIRKHGRDAALHAYFGGWFRKGRGKSWVPSRPSRPRARPKTGVPRGTGALRDLRRALVRSPKGTAGRGTATAGSRPALELGTLLDRPGAASTLNRATRRRDLVTAGPSSLPGPTYTVRRGDSLSAIARRLTGDGRRWREIYRHNRGTVGSNPNLIKPNQVLKLPPSWKRGGVGSGLGGRRAGSGVHVAPGSVPTYTVRRGDNLSAIARRLTGDAARWRELYRHNRGIVGGNPNLIKPSQVLKLPPSWQRYGAGSGLGTRRAGSGTRLGPSAGPTYSVQRGDNLSAIARRLTGDASRWRELYRNNRGTIGSNPNLIRPGQVFNLPPGWGQPPGGAQRPSFFSQISRGLR